MHRIHASILAGALLVAAPLTLPLAAQNVTPTAIPPRAPGVPGLRRDAGAWLFNDSIFVAPGDNNGLIGGPVFLPNLRRDKKIKLPLFMPSKGGVPVNFSTVPLPDLRSMSAPNFDFVALQTQLAAQVAAARAAGKFYVGWSLPTMLSINAPLGTRVGIVVPSQPLEKERTTAVLKQLRGVLDAIAPDSALILQVDTEATDRAIADLNVAAPACDAILLRVSLANENALWPLKMARRTAEEQPNYDLPIFVAPKPRGFPGGPVFSIKSPPLSDAQSEERFAPVASDDIFSPSQTASLAALNAGLSTYADTQWLKFFMAGATGFVLPAAQTPDWADSVARNPGLFSGAVTLEDAAVLPSANPHTLQIVDDLRAVGRIPLMGRLPGSIDPNGESLLAVLDDATSLDTLNGLDKAARAGNTLYLEGLPDIKNAALLAKIGDITGTTIEVLPAAKSDLLTLNDPWLFGDARGREFTVTQRVKWTIKVSLAAQARQKKGEDVLASSSAATLTGDDDGFLIAPLGKGRVLWLAHAPSGGAGDKAALRSYYAAIAGSLQGELVHLDFATPEAAARAGDKLTLQMRASKTGTPILAIFNSGSTDVPVTAAPRSDATLALDLISNQQIAAKVVGYASNVAVTVPANGFVWLTFGATRALLDKERLAPRPKARTVK